MDKLTELQNQMYDDITEVLCFSVCSRCNNPNNEGCKIRQQFEEQIVFNKEKNLPNIFFSFFSSVLKVLDIEKPVKSRKFFEKTDLIDFERLNNICIDCSECKGRESSEYDGVRQKIRNEVEKEIPGQLITAMICYFVTHKIFHRKMFDSFAKELGLSYKRSPDNHTVVLCIMTQELLKDKIEYSRNKVKETKKKLNAEFKKMYNDIYGRVNKLPLYIRRKRYTEDEMKNNLKKYISEYYYKIPDKQKYINYHIDVSEYFNSVYDQIKEKEFRFMPIRDKYRNYVKYVRKSFWFCGFDINYTNSGYLLERFPKYLFETFFDVISDISKEKFLKDVDEQSSITDTDRWQYLKNAKCINLFGRIYELYVQIILIAPEYKENDAEQIIKDSFHCAGIPELLSAYNLTRLKERKRNIIAYRTVSNKIYNLSK